MAKRLTTFSKLIIVFLILAILFFGGKYLMENTEIGKDLKQKSEDLAAEQAAERENDDQTKSSNAESKPTTKKEGGLFNKSGGGDRDEKTLRVQLVTWAGYAPGLYFNEGTSANTQSRYFKDYGFKVDFVREDDLNNALSAWAADEYDIIVQTADAFSFYTSPADLKPFKPQAFMQVDWSRGGDAIVAKRGINTINDLKGKKIALAVPAPAQTMLITALESAGLSYDDVKIATTSDNIAAFEMFKSKDIDAAVVWSPFDQEAKAAVPGSKVLLTTVEQSHIIGDIMFAKESVIQEKEQMINDFYEGWMRAVAEMKVKTNQEKAAKYLSKFAEVSIDDARGMMTTVHYTGHGDNLNFFGLNNDYRGMTGADLYDKMNRKFVEIGSNDVMGPGWRSVINKGPILAADGKLKGQQYAAEGAKKFTPATSAQKSAPALATKPVTISFPTGQYILSENAKTIIDLQFAEIAKSFGNLRVRVEGNTDNVGNRSMNMKLSERRAKSVADYLQSEYGMNPNRFVVIGNGPDKPTKGCEQNQNDECKKANRRTDFQLIPG